MRIGGDDLRAEYLSQEVKGVGVCVRVVSVPGEASLVRPSLAAVLVRHILLYGSAAVRRHACGLGPAPPLGDPLRDGGLVGSGQPAQLRGLAS